MNSTLLSIIVAAATTVAPGPWHVGQADVRVTCPLTIGGSFDAKTTALSGSVTVSAAAAPTFDGTLAVDLRTLDTGINLRNEHLRNKYLEIEKAPEFGAATLTKISVDGFSPDAPEGKHPFTAALTLHGVTKAVTGSVDLHSVNAGGLHVTALFPVTLSDYDIPAPRYLGVGVQDTIQIRVAFTAAR